MQPRSNPLPVNVWHYKPWWCQPWSILLTGIGIIVGSWGLTRLVWVAVLVAIPVLIWMGYFLLVYPKLVAESGLLSMDEATPKSQDVGSRRIVHDAEVE